MLNAMGRPARPPPVERMSLKKKICKKLLICFFFFQFFTEDGALVASVCGCLRRRTTQL